MQNEHSRNFRRQKSGRFLNAARLSPPKPEFDLARILKPEVIAGRHRSGFETEEQALQQEGECIRSLWAWADLLPSPKDLDVDHGIGRPDTARQLARALDGAIDSETLVNTYASPRFKRDYRRRYCGAVLDFLSRYDGEEVKLYTIVSQNWMIPGPLLAEFKPRALLQCLRTQLNRKGLGAYSGFFLATVHGSYDAERDLFFAHLHAVVGGEKAKAFEALRDLPSYRPSELVPRPIVALDLEDPARQLSYFLAQGFWPLEPPPIISMRDPKLREATRFRIPEPRHAEVLMWMDRQTFRDVVLLHGCTMREGSLLRSQAGPHPKIS